METTALHSFPGTGKKKNILTLYRRHSPKCGKTEQTLRPNDKASHAADTCACPINVHGYLEHEVGRIRHHPLDTSDWDVAEAHKLELLAAGRKLNVETKATAATAATTVQTAVDAFLNYKKNGSGRVAPATYDIYKTFCNSRFLPWCKAENITLITAFDNRDVAEKFDQSWKNMKDPKKDLADGARKTTKTVFTMLLGYCVDHDWLKKNIAKKIKTTKAKDRHSGKNKKYGLELHEYANILRYMDVAKIDQRMKVMIELMRYVGMRVSDGAKFCDVELVRNNGGWNADFIAKKNGVECSVPVPAHVVSMLKTLPFLHKNFWFRTGRANWRSEAQQPGTEIAAIMKATQDMYGAFNHPASAHALRHTFAIQHLNRGVDPRMVAAWMGDDLATVLKHYSHAIKSTKELSDDAGRKSNDAMLAETLVNKNKVATIRKRA